MYKRLSMLITPALVLLLAVGCTGASDPAAADLTGPAAAGDAAAVDPQLLADLQAELRRVLAARGITLDAEGRPVGKAISTLPQREYIAPDRFNDLINDQASLSWNYSMKGDYDWNGEVNVSDVTPVGIHFGKDTNSPDWQTARRADGDGNGEVNFADVTAIGQNFGAQLSGFVVQWKNLVTDDWSDFGFAEFDAQLVQQFNGEMGYSAPGMIFANDFRVAPVGDTREFSWTNYQLDDGQSSYYPAVLQLRNGQPAIAFVDQGAGRLLYGEASVPHPQSESDWAVSEVDPAGVIAQPPRLQIVNDVPSIAYVGESQVLAFQLRYARITQFNPPSATSQVHVMEDSVPTSSPEFILKDGLPVVSYAGAGSLYVFVTNSFAPAVSTDWFTFAVDSGINRPSLALVGNFLDVASFRPGSPAQIYFHRALVPAPSGPGEFTGYPLADLGLDPATPSLCNVGGYPCIAFENVPNSAVEYLRSGETKPDSSAVWFLHPLFSDPSDTSNPQLVLLDGRPAVAFGRSSLNFAWADREAPDSGADWLVSEAVNGEVNFNTYPPSIVVVDGLPVIAYTMYEPSSSSRHVFLAVASEE